MKINRNMPQQQESTNWPVLETDVYEMEIVDVREEEDIYTTNPDGTHPIRIVVCWQERQTGARVWQRFNSYYGVTRNGAPSRLKAFIDSLAEQGLVPDEFEIEALVGIRQRVSVEKYIKSMGPNRGQLGNRVTAVLPLRRSTNGHPRAASKSEDVIPATTDAEDIPF